MVNGTNFVLGLDCDFGLRGGGSINDARPINSERIKKRFPGYVIYSVDCSAGGNPVFISQPLVIGTPCIASFGTPIGILGNAPTVAAFITTHKQPVHSQEEAQELLDLFAELQGWSICRKMPEEALGFMNKGNSESVAKWEFQGMETGSGWTFTAVFMTDPFVKSYDRYFVEIFTDGSIRVKMLDYMGSHAMYL